jgi:seryl-tRNA synthetase
MLDINLIRNNPKMVKENQKKRGMDEKEVDLVLELDKKWRGAKQEVDNLRAERNKVSENINNAKKQKKNVDELIKRAKEIPIKLQEKESEMKENEEKRNQLLENLPCILDKSVPVAGVSKNKVIEVIGKPKKLKNAKGHEELMTSLGLLDIERAAKVSGARFYYLKRELVKLNQALINFALDFLSDKGFILMQPPYMLKKDALKGALNFSTFGEMIYKIEGEDLYLIGTAEHALNAYFINEALNQEELPVRFTGFSPCFRREAGSHGKDTKGIFRTHQFEKVEQFVFCKPENSWKEFDLILKNTKEIFQKLGIPFRMVILSSEDTGRVAAKTVDFEGLFPSQGEYKELGSCSNCLDYQARRSNIKFEENGERKFVHTLNNTAIATERMLCCIFENYQKKDGSIKIPNCLWKYTGFKTIKPIKKSK